MNEITTVGVDLAKEVIAVCGADRSGKTVFTRIFRREAFAAWAVQLPPCEFGLEACGAAHHWARWELSENQGWVSVRIDHDTARFAAEAIRQWWKKMGAKRYRHARELLITAAGGGSNR